MTKFNEINSFDYAKLNKAFSEISSVYLGLTLIESGGVGNRPEAPFIVFDIISPYIPIDTFFDESDEECFEAIVSFTSYSETKNEALRITQALRKIINQFDVDLKLRKLNIVIAEIMPTNVRSIQEAVLDKFMVGFDVRLRLRETYSDPSIEIIKDVEL